MPDNWEPPRDELEEARNQRIMDRDRAENMMAYTNRLLEEIVIELRKLNSKQTEQ